MKLLVIMASRGNPSGLLSTITSIMNLASGKHEIIVKVGIDDDDAASLAYTPTIKNIYPSVQFVIVERKPSLGAVLNELAKGENAGAYLPLTDRMTILTPHWDDIVANASMHFYNQVLWWQMEQGCIMPIITKKWYEASGQIFTEYFPFWFDDTWLVEVSAYVHGNAGTALPVTLWRKPGGKTKRCHDMKFWMDYFIALRGERRAHAAMICQAFRLPPNLYDDRVNENVAERDHFWSYSWQQMEKEFGDPSPRDDTYYAAAKAAGWDDKDIAEAKERE